MEMKWAEQKENLWKEEKNQGQDHEEQCLWDLAGDSERVRDLEGEPEENGKESFEQKRLACQSVPQAVTGQVI